MFVLDKEPKTSEVENWTIGGEAELALLTNGPFTAAWFADCVGRRDWGQLWAFIKERGTFPLLWLFIGMVSAYDSYLVIRYSETIWYLESNPVGRMLLNMQDGRPSLFMAVKFLGTIFALGLLIVARHFNKTMGGIIAAWVAGFQLLLLAYLVLA